MKSFGLAFLITGILLIGLSGLEKILIYVALNNRVGDYEVLKMITPNEIWNITTSTFIFGLLLSIIGLVFSSWKFMVIQSRKIRETNSQFEMEQGLNTDNSE